jgi:hypothetical protein
MLDLAPMKQPNAWQKLHKSKPAGPDRFREMTARR